MFAGIARDTRGCGLSESQRWNFFPASPLCSVTWYFEGAAKYGFFCNSKELDHIGDKLPKVFVTGPTSQPLASWNPGPVLALTAGFYPESWALLAGRPVAPLACRIAAPQEACSSDFAAILDEVGNQNDPVSAWALLETKLEPFWKERRPAGHSAPRKLADWARSVVTRSMVSGAGRSVRQAQRRAIAQTGQTLRDLHKIIRRDAAFRASANAKRSGNANWSQVAADSGFADQSHFIGYFRKATGFTPQRMADLIDADEALWCYRLFGEDY